MTTFVTEDEIDRNWEGTSEGPSLRLIKSPGEVIARPKVSGKFLVKGEEKFFVKGVTYGAFSPNSQGHQFPEPQDVEADFALMRAAGVNTILTYTVPPVSFLDQAGASDLRVIVNIPWMEYICFLKDATTKKQIGEKVRADVASCRRHPAVLMYAVAKEIPPQIVRWHGPRKVEAFLRDLYLVAKNEDPESLVTYTNFPTTEYLELPFVDVFTFNVYLHQRQDFSAYMSRLQHLAGERPFVLTELGMCSLRHGEERQADFIDWQLEETFDHGCAGVVIFGWTDPFFQDGCLIDEWGFGLVNADRKPKPSYDVVARRFTTSTPFPPDRQWPKVTVVVAAYNSGRTIDKCLKSLMTLNYPDYEVIVVNDGSTDDTEEIAKLYPFRLITTENRGVSSARNEGLFAATGEIVAYIDSDARADPDWLAYLVTNYLTSDVDGVGGPNFAPSEDNWIAKCVYRSPGGPTQVMLDDVYSEHIPGCNMSFRKEALEEIGGFNPIFTAAGDDVDICWRLLDKGYKIGFSPSAVVWHHRRPSAKAYWKQQVGYGRSEALLEGVHPNKFNPWGHTFWQGRIYAPYPFFHLFNKPIIYHGLWGSAGFQPMYESGSGGILSFLPRAMEFHTALIGLLLLSPFWPWALVPFALGTLYILLYCVACARKARSDDIVPDHGPASRMERFRRRAMIAWLHFLEPVARDWGHLKGGLTPWRTTTSDTVQAGFVSKWWQRMWPFGRTGCFSYSGGKALERLPLIEQLSRKLLASSCAVGWNRQTEDWDLRIRRGALGAAILRVVIEHHGGPKRLTRVSFDIKPPGWFYWTLANLAVLFALVGVMGFWTALPILMIAMGALWVLPIREANRLEATIRDAVDRVRVASDVKSF